MSLTVNVFQTGPEQIRFGLVPIYFLLFVLDERNVLERMVCASGSFFVLRGGAPS